MKYTIIFIFLSIFSSRSQNVVGKIIDSLTNKPIEFVNISYVNSDYGTSTNKDGIFVLKLKKDNVLISSIGYHSKTVNPTHFLKDTDTIQLFLKPKTEFLTEVFIAKKRKKVKYKKTKKVGIKKGTINIKSSFRLGYEYTCLIKNPYHKKGKVTSVILDIVKVKNPGYFVSYNLKFYKFNKIKNEPGELIYHKNYIVKPKNKTYQFEIKLKDIYIPFLKEGICVGVEIIKSDDSSVSRNTTLAPRLNVTFIKDSSLLTWSRYRSKKWNVFSQKTKFLKNKYRNARIRLKVKFKK